MKIGITTTKLWDDNTRLVFKRLYNLHNYINFSFIEGVNRPNCEAVAKQFKMYCIGSLFYKDYDFEDQILEACELVDRCNVKYLMLGNQKVREYVAEGKYKLNLQQLYMGMFGVCSHLGLKLMFEPLKGTYPSTLSEVVRLQNMYNVSSMHICLKNTDINSNILDIVMPNTIQNCHISLALYLKYYESIKHLDRVTLEI